MPSPVLSIAEPSQPLQLTAAAPPIKGRRLDYSYDDLVSWGWPAIVRNVIFAGGAYPIILVLAFFAMTAAKTLLLEHNTTADEAGLFAFGPIFAVFGGVVGLAWASAVAVLSLCFVHLVLWSSKLRPRLVWLGAVFGGLVGFLGVLPIALSVPPMFSRGLSAEALTTMLLGPGLTTLLGQIAGALGGLQAEEIIASRIDARQRFQSRYARENANQCASHSAIEAVSGGFQFGVIHLMWTAVWLSLLLTVIRLSGIPYGLALPVLIGWLIYQIVTLVAGRLAIRRFGPWWKARQQSRST